jgi:hypothetical protein
MARAAPPVSDSTFVSGNERGGLFTADAANRHVKR